MDRSYVSDIERGRAAISVDSFLRICSAAGVAAPRMIAKVEASIASSKWTKRQGMAKNS
jgi:transcriptional regulator with XRE-family HTH domain